MTTIVIESKTFDAKKHSLEESFLRSVIKTIPNPKQQDFEFLHSGGWEKLGLLDSGLKERIDQGNKILIIFDADTQKNNGGFAKRITEIEEILKEISISADIFLFPNNSDDGDFECLLEKAINSEHIVLLKCFEKYENCLKQYKEEEIEKYQTPNQKSKMYAYINSFKTSRKANEQKKNQDNWQFDNPDFWDLNNEYLNHLKEFLSK
jgi:hypothetical protein